MSVSASDFRSGMRQLAAAVNVITTLHDGARAGMTATAVSSLTAEPPQLGVAVNRGNASFALIDASDIFAVNVLPHDHADLASRFAGGHGAKGEERFSHGRWGQLVTGAPILLDGAACFDCRVVRKVDLSSHVLFVGEVVAVRTAPTATPLLFMDGTWASLVRASDHDFRAYDGVIGQIEEAMGAVIASGGQPTDQLRDFSRSFAQISAGSIEVLREFFRRETFAPADKLTDINRRKRGIETRLRDLLARGAAAGEFEVVDPAATAVAIIGMMNSIHRWPEDQERLGSDAVGEQLGALVAAMVAPRGRRVGKAPASAGPDDARDAAAPRKRC